MKKQIKTILIKIDEDLKTKFIKKATDCQMKISSRIKYLMKLDVDGKIRIDNL